MEPLVDEPLDVLVRGGHVIDPASGLDAVRDIGIRYGRIVAIEDDLSARIFRALCQGQPRRSVVGRRATSGEPGRV